MSSETKKIPFLRPGVLHFISSFFRLDEDNLLTSPETFALHPNLIEKGAMEFLDTIAPSTDKKHHGWEILYTALGIPKEDLDVKKDESPQKYVTRLWSKIMIAQGITMYVEVEGQGTDRYWKFRPHFLSTELIKTGYRLAKERCEKSPQIFTKDCKTRQLTYLIEDSGDMKKIKKLGLTINKAIEEQKKILFLTADTISARESIKFLFQYGVEPIMLGTTRLVTLDTRICIDPEKIDEKQCLLLGANYIPLRYLPNHFDLIILWDFHPILETLHVKNPLPNFISMSRESKEGNPPLYFKHLWKAADLFHFFRHYIQEAKEVWVTDISTHGSPYHFLKKIRGVPRLVV